MKVACTSIVAAPRFRAAKLAERSDAVVVAILWRHEFIASATPAPGYARMPSTTWPATSVRRKSRPW